MKQFYGRLVGKPYKDGAIDWNKLTLTDADAVKYLINLVGDLHQPLHLGFDEGDHGRNITVSFRGKQVSLFDLWDKEITQAVIKDGPGFWWSGWTHVQRVRSEYEMDSSRWKQSGAAMFDKWAEESARFACEDVYTNPVSGRRISEEAKDQGGIFKVHPALYERWKQALASTRTRSRAAPPPPCLTSSRTRTRHASLS